VPTIDNRVWLAWILAGIAWGLWFAVAEGIAIVNRHGGDTLTEVTRSLNLPTFLWFLGGGLLVGFTVWWPLHLKLGW
jgi:hypothetical protein